MPVVSSERRARCSPDQPVRSSVSGSLADPVVLVDVVGRCLSYGSVAVADLSANATVTSGRLAIERLDVTSSFGAAHVTGDLTSHKAPGMPSTNRILARITNVHLDPLLDAGIALPVRLSSRATGELNVTLARHHSDRLEAGSDGERFRSAHAGRIRPPSPDNCLHLDRGRWTIGHTSNT